MPLNLIITLSLLYVQHFWLASFWDRFWCYSHFTVHNYCEYAFVLLSYFPLPLVTMHASGIEEAQHLAMRSATSRLMTHILIETSGNG